MFNSTKVGTDWTLSRCLGRSMLPLASVFSVEQAGVCARPFWRVGTAGAGAVPVGLEEGGEGLVQLGQHLRSGGADVVSVAQDKRVGDVVLGAEDVRLRVLPLQLLDPGHRGVSAGERPAYLSIGE